MEARKAAAAEGWYELIPNHWVHNDLMAVLFRTKPLYFIGSARDLCLGNGIDFDDDKDNAGIV